MRGYFLPLSGGADSSTTATMVAIMCQRVVDELANPAASERSKEQVLEDVRKITRMSDYTPASWQDLCSKLFVTCYMGSEYSGDETRERAALLAEQIGSVHTSILIDDITDGIKSTFAKVAVHSGRTADAPPVCLLAASLSNPTAATGVQLMMKHSRCVICCLFWCAHDDCCDSFVRTQRWRVGR
jgi:NH3-dependent NAD+ synthetase